MSERQYSEVEVTAILRTAAESQAQSMEPGTGGMTLSEIQRLASEVGIDSRHVTEAARARDTEKPLRQKLGFWGPPSRVVLDSQVEGALDDTAWEEILDACREVTRTSGSAEATASNNTWAGGGDILQVHFSAKSNHGSTRLRLIFNQSALMFVVWAMACMFAFTLLMVMSGQLHRAGWNPLTITALCIAGLASIHAVTRVGLALWASKNTLAMQRLLERAGTVIQSHAADPLAESKPVTKQEMPQTDTLA